MSLKESVSTAVQGWFDSNLVHFTDYYESEGYIKELEKDFNTFDTVSFNVSALPTDMAELKHMLLEAYCDGYRYARDKAFRFLQGEVKHE